MRLDRRRLQRVLEFIEAHIEDDLNVATLASTACLSPLHFARVFKTATGESPHQYVSARRLEHAKALLTQTDRTLVDISPVDSHRRGISRGRSAKLRALRPVDSERT